MIVKISNELKGLLFDYLENQSPFVNTGWGDLEFWVDLSGNEKLIRECQKWIDHIHNYFKTSFMPLKVNLGFLEGVFPTEIRNGLVCFRADYCDLNKKSWKDWFIIEEIEDPPQFTQEKFKCKWRKVD